MNKQDGFSLIELISILIIVGVITISLSSRFGSVSTASVQAGRDDLIAALFFAKQTSLARDTIRVEVTSTTISVTENNVAIHISENAYPLTLPRGVTVTSPATPFTIVYDKLGYTTARTITLTGSGGTANVKLEASGYAY